MPLHSLLCFSRLRLWSYRHCCILLPLQPDPQQPHMEHYLFEIELSRNPESCQFTKYSYLFPMLKLLYQRVCSPMKNRKHLFIFGYLKSLCFDL